MKPGKITAMGGAGSVLEEIKIEEKAERYASEGQIYGMHVYIENAINYAAKAGIDISGELPKFMHAYEEGLKEALQEAEKHEAEGFLGMSYQYIHRAGNYAEKLGRDIEDILKSLPWYEKWMLTDIHTKSSNFETVSVEK